MSGLKKTAASRNSDSTLEELDQIMNEIEELQEEMDTETRSLKESPHEFRPDEDWAGMEETLSNLEEEPPSGHSLFDQMTQETEKENAEVVEMKEMQSAYSTEKETDGSLTMTLTGNMTLKLKYAYGGHEVVVGFNEQFLVVQMADGTEFKVPVGRPTLKRKVA